MFGHTDLDRLFEERGYTEYKWIDPREIVVARWVRMKCMYGCNGYGKLGTCPPNTPTIEEAREFFSEYRFGVIFHFPKFFENPDDRHDWGTTVNLDMLRLERDVFIRNYRKAFLMFMNSCEFCKECTGTREGCKNNRNARPTPEAMGIDVYKTVQKYGFPINVLSDYNQTMNRYAFLLVE